MFLHNSYALPPQQSNSYPELSRYSLVLNFKSEYTMFCICVNIVFVEFIYFVIHYCSTFIFTSIEYSIVRLHNLIFHSTLDGHLDCF